MIRGLTVVMPPLLTIVIFFWIAGTINVYVLEPLTGLARDIIVWSIADVRTVEQLPKSEREGQALLGDLDPKSARQLQQRLLYQNIANGGKGKYIPASVYAFVKGHDRVESMPGTAKDIYRKYVEIKYLQPYHVIPYFLCGFILVLYLLGKFMAGAVGRFFWGTFERGVNRLPLVRNVYSSVKQVSDFIFANREIEYSRVVAVEWPRKGIWCLALVTGSSLKAVEERAGEEVLSVLIPTSPMPMTGFTVTVKKSETIDLDITIDQAIQFIVSCGVVVPADQMSQMQSATKTSPQLIAASDAPESPSADT